MQVIRYFHQRQSFTHPGTRTASDWQLLAASMGVISSIATAHMTRVICAGRKQAPHCHSSEGYCTNHNMSHTSHNSQSPCHA
jgi:hypothetical protein